MPSRVYDFQVVGTVLQREARLCARNLGVYVTLGFIVVGSVILIREIASRAGRAVSVGYSAQELSMILDLFIITALALVIMMNSTLLGASIVDDKDKKVAEMLLSAASPRELFLGKLMGHVTVGLGQVVLAWTIVTLTMFCMVPGAADSRVLMNAVVLLAFFIPGYVFFTALHAALGAAVSRNENYMVAQIPVLAILVVTQCAPFLPLIGKGSLSEGWLSMAAWFPPLSITMAPLVYLIGAGSAMQLMVAWILVAATAVTSVIVGSAVFHRRILL